MAHPARVPAWKPGKNPERLGARYFINRADVLARTTIAAETLDPLVQRGVLPVYHPEYAKHLVLFDTAMLDEFFAWAAANYEPSGKPGRSVVEDLSAFEAKQGN